jgi:23S rRNA pseudouridine2605 synthase
MIERLQKFLAASGIASRRKAEALIVEGRVQVNSVTVTELGTKVDPARDLVTVDGKLVAQSGARAYYLLYKPSGCLTTASDPQGRPTALEYLRGVTERVFPVGRLDWDAEGAVLFTDDGELANRLAHPRYGHRRTYLVKVKGDPAPEALLRMTAGVRLEDGPARALEASVHEHAEKNVWLRIVVGEGRYHLVKRLCEAVGLQVARLFRPEFGGVTVDRLRPGAFRPLSADEVDRMRRSVGLEGGGQEPAPAMPRNLLPRAARRHGHGPPAPPRGASSAAARPEGTSTSAAPRAPGTPALPRRREVGEGGGVRGAARAGGASSSAPSRGREAGEKGGRWGTARARGTSTSAPARGREGSERGEARGTPRREPRGTGPRRSGPHGARRRPR